MQSNKNYTLFLGILLAIISVSLVIFFSDNIFTQWGCIFAGLTASLVEPFYENAGAVTGKWEFHDSNMKVGHLSWEMIPIAFSGTILGVFFCYNVYSLANISNIMMFISGLFIVLNFVIFTWLSFKKKINIETLWLVIPLFAFSISFSLPEFSAIILATLYIGAFLETLLIQRTNAYTYKSGYKPAVTSLAYGFFISFCYAVFLKPETNVMNFLINFNPFIPWLVTLFVGLIHSYIIISGLQKKQSPKGKE